MGQHITLEELERALRRLKPGETWQPNLRYDSTGGLQVTRFINDAYEIDGNLLDLSPDGAFPGEIHAKVVGAHTAALVAWAVRGGCGGFWHKKGIIPIFPRSSGERYGTHEPSCGKEVKENDRHH